MVFTEMHGYGCQLTFTTILSSRLATEDIMGYEAGPCFFPAALDEFTGDHLRYRILPNLPLRTES